jgi:hypothetical protein
MTDGPIPGNDILRHMLEVERDAAGLEGEAREAAVARLREARSLADSRRTAALLARQRELGADWAEFQAVAAAGRRGRLAACQAELAASPQDRAALLALVRRLLAGGLP